MWQFPHAETIVPANAIRFVNPVCGVLPDRITKNPESCETVYTPNPLTELKTACLHEQMKAQNK